MSGSSPAEVEASEIASVAESAGPIDLLRQTLRSWRDHAALQWGAALAFYAVLSLAPLLLLLLSVAGPFVGSSELENVLERHARELIGPGGAQVVRTVSAGVQRDAGLPKGIALVTLVVASMVFFVQLQAALNHIWDGRPRQRHVWRFLRRRLQAILLTIVLGGLLVVSMLGGAAIRAATKWLELAPLLDSGWLLAANWVGSNLLFAALLAVFYKALPDVRLEWRDVGVGVVSTTVLFAVGRWLIGLYLRHSGVGSLYGAASSLILLLVWLYYSAQAVLLGAEFTRVWAARCGRPLQPKPRRRAGAD